MSDDAVLYGLLGLCAVLVVLEAWRNHQILKNIAKLNDDLSARLNAIGTHKPPERVVEPAPSTTTEAKGVERPSWEFPLSPSQYTHVSVKGNPADVQKVLDEVVALTQAVQKVGSVSHQGSAGEASSTKEGSTSRNELTG